MSFGSLAGGRGQSTMDNAVAQAEVLASTFASAWVTAAYPQTATIMNMDTTGVVGAVLSLGGLLDGGGSWGPHASRIGNGMLAVYLTRLGATQGAKFAAGSSDQTKQGPAKSGTGLPAGTPGFSVGANQAYAARRY